jgi:hypothetical protein
VLLAVLSQVAGAWKHASVAEDSMELYPHDPLPIHLYSALLRHRQFFLTAHCKEILYHFQSESGVFSFLVCDQSIMELSLYGSVALEIISSTKWSLITWLPHLCSWHIDTIRYITSFHAYLAVAHHTRLYSMVVSSLKMFDDVWHIWKGLP